MAKTSSRVDRSIKKARREATTKKPRARFAEPEPNPSPLLQNSSKKKTVQLKEPTPPPGPSKNKGKAKATNPPETSGFIEQGALPTTFKIIAGSYEKLLYGVEGKTSYTLSTNAIEFHLSPIFAFPAHVSCIKAVAASPQGGKWLATGSADEIIKVWDLRRRKEIGGLMHHEGSITHLIFPSRSHLFSASEDGTLCLFHARDWTVLRALKGHKGRVNSIAAHPSGKVALSVGKDRTLRMWDLMRGKGVASTKLGKEGEIVRWSTDGTLFAVQSGSTIDVYNAEMTLLHTIQHPSRIHDVKFCSRVTGTGELLLVGAEDKKLSIYNLPQDPSNPPTIISEMVGHGNRVKAIQTLQIALPQICGRISTTIVATVSSDGKIRVFDLNLVPVSSLQEAKTIEAVAEYDTKGTRLTCVTLADDELFEGGLMNGKRKHEAVVSSDEEDDAFGEIEVEEEGESKEEED